MDNNVNSFHLPKAPISTAVNVENSLSIEQALELANKFQQDGRFQDSEKLLRKILKIYPDHPHAIQLLGILAHLVGKTDLAINLIKKAIKLDPKAALFYTNIAEIYRISGFVEMAVEYGEKAVDLDPNLYFAHTNLGIAYFDKERYDDATKCHERAIQLNSQSSASYNNLGSISLKNNNKEKAVEYYQKLLDINPDDVDGLSNMGATLVLLNKNEEAISCLDRAIALKENNAKAHCSRGFACLAIENEDEAIISFTKAMILKADYSEAMIGMAKIRKSKNDLIEATRLIERSIELNPQVIEAQTIAGSLYLLQGYADKAEKHFKKVLRMNPESYDARLGLGQIMMERGNIDDAIRIFTNLIEYDQDRVEALFSLVYSAKVNAQDEVVEILKKHEKKVAEYKESKKIKLHFALGKIYEDLKDYDKAFVNYIKGCNLKRDSLSYDHPLQDLKFKNITEIFNIEFIKKYKDAGCKSKLPIFVVGMPRSGTTLTEQIIASHPDVYGAGELFELLEIAGHRVRTNVNGSFPENISALSADQILQIGQEYVSQIKKRGGKSKRVTDKMPANFINIGLIHMILPKAKIIHVNRHPLDNCISCFSRLFTYNQEQTYDLYELGRYYNNYKTLMDHWRNILPKDSFYDVHYEDLVNDTENEAKKLIDYCELDWHESCLEFYNNKRNIRTASVAQVRHPIYKTSLNRWKKYDKFLDPLKEGLGNSYQEN